MFVDRRIKLRHVLYYSWRSLAYFAVLSIVVYLLHYAFDMRHWTIPFNGVAMLSTALAIYLGFKNNSAYDRWWEGRKIWGLLVNYSRAWARQIVGLVIAPQGSEEEVRQWKKVMVYRHIAFVHALRVFLRQKHDYAEDIDEFVEDENRMTDLKGLVTHEEYVEVLTKENPPNWLLLRQSEELQQALQRGWISDYRLVQLDQTLVEFNNHQGRAERIKNTPLPRPYSFFSRIFVFVHGTLVPFAFIDELGWANIPLSLTINFVFLHLDAIGERTEDPFENRMDDVPLSAISTTIEENLREMLGERDLPPKPRAVQGAILCSRPGGRAPRRPTGTARRSAG